MADTATAQPVPNAHIDNEKLAVSQHLSPNGTQTPRPDSFESADDSFKTTESQPLSAEHDQEWTPPAAGPLKTPIPKPLSSCKPIASAKLTPEQETKYDTVLAAVSQWQTIPATTARNAPQASLEEHERMFLTRECLLRYLRATKWKTADALKRLQQTLSWRREYGADTFTHDYIGPENETGKQLLLGYDNDARPCLYLNPAKQNTKMSDRQIHHMCYMLDRMVELMPPGVENGALLINFKGAANGSIPSVGQARAVLNILQGHNPERLGKALISETPWYVNTFFKLISPFIDPVTREKMKFNEDLRKYVPPSQLWNQHEGDLNFEYDHSVYWPALDVECTKRREAYRERWQKAGKQLGEFEEYLRGGAHPSLQESIAAAQGNGALDTSTQTDAGELAAQVGKLSV